MMLPASGARNYTQPRNFLIHRGLMETHRAMRPTTGVPEIDEAIRQAI